MYESFYGFKEKPFNLTPDPDYLYMSQSHEETYTHLEYAISENKGFVVITGEIGSGKTTLINYLLRKLKPNIDFAVISHTLIQPKQFLKLICQEFELPVIGMDKAEMIDIFYDYLLKQFAKKRRVALIIDESQNLPDKTLEEIRMLSNLESEKNHLLQILLVGQPELKNKLQEKNLMQFIQRVTVYWHLKALDENEVYLYIRHRLWVAGSENLELFDEKAIKAVHHHSRGIPRMINIICDAALVHGFADELTTITEEVITDIVKMNNIGGLLAKSEESIKKRNQDVTVYDSINKHLSHQLQEMEKRISTIERNQIRVDTELRLYSANRDKSDELILELTKMLKQSIRSQARLLLEIIELRSKIKRSDVIMGEERGI